MADSFFCVMDSETGGLDPKKSDILTLYMAMTDDDLKVIDELDLKLKPDGRLPIADAGALEVNKIDLQKHLTDPNTITYSEAKVKIVAFVKKYLKKRGKYSNIIVLGQNVMFDLNFIWEYICNKQDFEAIFSYNVEDTKTAALFLKRCGWLPKEIGTLSSLVEYFNIPKREAHEAKGDVHMTIDVYKAMISLMKSKKDGGSSQDIISLLESE
jgi:DNA polymerase III alpha subunit (gram-positive type)